ncbi:MAG TPA: DinB family protein [Phycisphaerae bacterium]|nr:DinB family protein [Phycisphaerae bacterium]
MAMHPATQVLLAILENQVNRTEAAFDGLNEEVLTKEPGGDCNSILRIGRHLIGLRRFQLSLLGSADASKVADPKSIGNLAQLLPALHQSAALVRDAIREHDADDWFAQPDAPREGPWCDEPTIHRLVRPLSDFTNHLGAVRAIRRMYDCPAERTQ